MTFDTLKKDDMLDLERAVAENTKPGLYEVMAQMQTVVHNMSYAIEFENKAVLLITLYRRL